LFIPDRFVNLNNAPTFKKVGIWSGTLPHGEFEAAHSRRRKKAVTAPRYDRHILNYHFV